MRLLFDQNLSFKLCKQLHDLFPGSTQVRLLGMAESHDRILWNYAAEHGLILVSQDSDFAEMAALFGPPPKVIWLRTGNCPTSVMEGVLRRSADALAAFANDPEKACLELF
jgi:predicted nuclease of predicted toxin-antitoxin system